MSNDVSGGRSIVLVICLLLVITVLISWDLITDYRSGSTTGHLAAEFAIMSLSAVAAAVLFRRWWAARRAVTDLTRSLEAVREDAARWRAEAGDLVQGLAQKIDGQFQRWQLTPAERGVAMMLLRGLAHKEIAAERQTTERTVREQARGIYRKAGLPGRSALAAFFLDDLLVTPAGDSKE
jgi:DNA-binding CsgD family transcriptional regulator